MLERPPFGRLHIALLAAFGAALMVAWALSAEWLFEGRARDALPAHGASLLAGMAAAWVGGHHSGRYGQAFLIVLAGFAAAAVVAAIAWYGFLLPAACDKGADC